MSFETVWAKQSDFSRGVEVGRCTAKHAGDEKRMATCIEGVRNKGVGFFTEKCHHDFSVSVNGVEHSLKKWAPKLNRFLSYEEMTALLQKGNNPFPSKTPGLVGLFEGEGIRLRVSKPKLIDRELDETAGPGDDPVLSETFRVQVELIKDRVKTRFSATLGVEHK